MAPVLGAVALDFVLDGRYDINLGLAVVDVIDSSSVAQPRNLPGGDAGRPVNLDMLWNRAHKTSIFGYRQRGSRKMENTIPSYWRTMVTAGVLAEGGKRSITDRPGLDRPRSSRHLQ